MTSRTEWEEYFELINDRRPNENEIAAAFQKGEFEDAELKRMAEQVAHEQGKKAPRSQQEPVQHQNQGGGQAPANNQKQNAGYAQQQAAVNNESDGFDQVVNNEEQSNPALNNFKKQANNFFGWYWERAIHPTKHLNDEKPQTAFLWLGFAITVLLSAGVFWNIFRRSVDTFANYVRNSNSFGSSVASKVSSIGGQVLPTVFFDFLIIFIIVFLAALAGLTIVTRNKVNFKVLLNQYLVWFPTASLFAAASFVYSFITSVPSIQVISNMVFFLNTVITTLAAVLGILVLAIAVNQYSAYYFVQKHQEGNAKIDLIWWQVLQFVVTAAILVIAYDMIVSPMFQSLFSTISNAITSAY